MAGIGSCTRMATTRGLYLIRTTQASCKTRNVICCRGKRLLFFESGTSCHSSTTHDADSPRFAHIMSTTDAEKGVCLVCLCVCVCVYGFVTSTGCFLFCFFLILFYFLNQVNLDKSSLSISSLNTHLQRTQVKLFL